jgi:carboxypeptidase Taq
MTMTQTPNYLQQHAQFQQKVAAYSLALATMSWDAYTIAPKAGGPYRNRMMAYLQGELFSITTAPEAIERIETMSTMQFDEITNREIAQMKKELDKARFIPKDIYVAFSELVHNANDVWEDAKAKSDYSLFKPVLQQLIDQTKILVSYRKDSRPVYDQLLDDFETGMSMADYDRFFDKLRSDLVPVIHKIRAKQVKKPEWLNRKVPIEAQAKVVELLAKHLDYSKDSGAISVSVHPFSQDFSAKDNRVTVRYLEDQFTSSIFALIHEVGHATYNGQVDVALDGRYVRKSMTYGMHESQSRFLENMIGRSKAFWIPIYEEVQRLVDALKDVSLDEFIAGINHVEPSLIRIEADELTYPLHIMVRYEIEKGLFDGSLSAENLDQVWADKVEAYLGIRPQTAALGVLQDVHWSGAAFGYFPTYALGSAYSAQWMHALRKDMDVEAALIANNFKAIKAWLADKIHRHGGIYEPKELLLEVTGEPFNPQYYVDYLVAKATALYQL